MFDSNVAKSILELVQNSKNILLHLHPSPDGDSIGSSLAMMHVLKRMGKQVTVISGDSAPPPSFSGLPGFGEIVNQNYIDLDKSQFDLFIIHDSSKVDQISKKGEVVFPGGLKTAVIDHHASNSGYGDINLIDASSPANCQVLFEVFEVWGVDITPEIAICLLTGIYLDSMFRYPGTTVKTFEIAAKLSAIYPDFPAVFSQIENSSEPEKVFLLGMALSNIETYFDNKVAVAVVTQEMMKKKDILKRHIENNEISNTLRTVKDWEVAVSFIEIEPGQFNASFRTRDVETFDLSKIALELGGGGHKGAAGARISSNLDDARQVLIKALEKTYSALKNS